MTFLREIGCDLVQGYHIARPMPGSDVVPWARNHDATRESLRLEALRALNVLDTPEESRFDRLTRLAQRLFRTPIALVSLVDEDRQWFKSHAGLAVRETPRDTSFCAFAIEDEDVTVVSDARLDRRFQRNPLVTATPGIRFYAGCPLRTAGGSAVGTLCVIDTVPRTLSEEERALLIDLAALVEKELHDHHKAITDPLTGVLNRHGFEGRAADAVRLAERLGQPATLLFIDLNDLKGINDRFGHTEGDRALAAFSGMLQESFRESDLIARIGGDEFVVLMIDAAEDEALQIRQRLGRALATYNAQDGVSYELGAAVGIATLHPGQQKDLQALLAEADALMYQDKPN
jgi:diguanylate cyclase (GGDEF)-like protein